ncbi:DsrE family protein [Idiomarina seosinensis]|uniref:Sulfur relay protein TusD/DsrE n=1 Tax=Idiomarina seosinensis TaxID=281739 RepID=A0A432ZHX1_9GAMM|nr:DsrE family protein [Idiomarina seosinensis]RUO77484.1 sulfur relay protein TusD/DsrE [Idiomarina seosinensis]
MSKLCLVLQRSINEASFSERALRFARQAVSEGHQLNCVFFYRQSVDHAQNNLNGDSKALQQQWQSFSQQSQVPLVACHTVAERLNINDFAEGFEDSGLTALVAAMAQADRTLQF